jgi:hypothetical protein
MKNYASLGLLFASLFIGCARLPSKTYTIDVDGKKARAEIYFTQDAVSYYNVYFDYNKGSHSVITIKSGHLDENKNGIPDAGFILVGCSQVDGNGNIAEHIVPYEKRITSTDELTWMTPYSGPQCELASSDLLTASKAEESVKKAVENGQ